MVSLSSFKAMQAEMGGNMPYEGTENWPMIFTRAGTPTGYKTLGQAQGLQQAFHLIFLRV